MNNDDVVFILKEMFKRVGLEYDPTFVTQPEWYTQHSWTPNEQDKFRNWLIGWFMRKFHYSRRRATLEAHYIVSHVGWKLTDNLEATDE